jgi:hypothetical protein
MPALASCPHCGVHFINGVGPRSAAPSGSPTPANFSGPPVLLLIASAVGALVLGGVVLLIFLLHPSRRRRDRGSRIGDLNQPF